MRSFVAIDRWARISACRSSSRRRRKIQSISLMVLRSDEAPGRHVPRGCSSVHTLSCRSATSQPLTELNVPELASLIQALEQHDVVGDGRSRDGQSLAVARPRKGSDRAAVGEACELTRSATAERLHPEIPVARVGDAATVRGPGDRRVELSGADRSRRTASGKTADDAVTGRR